eukprot:m.33225 g.33225  ORF g.33225 m.33225 type:complete len:389 (+) comp12210_c0_seq1:127-1293(+)
MVLKRIAILVLVSFPGLSVTTFDVPSIAKQRAAMSATVQAVKDILPSLIPHAQKHSFTRRSALTLTVVTYDYRHVALNGLASMARFNMAPLWLCADDDIVAWLSTANLRCLRLRYDQNIPKFAALWHLRMVLAHELLKRGIDVFLVDSDALWLQDAMLTISKELAAPASAHVIAQRGSWPPDVSRALGATVCCGFMYLRSGAASIELLQRVVSYPHLAGFDDQVQLNQRIATFALPNDSRRYDPNPNNPNPNRHELSQAQLKSSVKWLSPPEQPPNMLKYVESTVVARVSFGRLNVSFLPHSTFPRLCEKRDVRTATMAHCFLEKNGTSKEDGLKASGLWFVTAELGKERQQLPKMADSIESVTPLALQKLGQHVLASTYMRSLKTGA